MRRVWAPVAALQPPCSLPPPPLSGTTPHTSSAMHPVLLIDEVFQVILEHCADWPASDYRFILCQLARSCRAWQDPATDRLWKRLESAEPLLRLLSLDQADAEVVRPHVLVFLKPTSCNPAGNHTQITVYARLLCSQSQARHLRHRPSQLEYRRRLSSSECDICRTLPRWLPFLGELAMV